VIELCSVYLIDGVSCHNAFAFHLDSISLGIGALLCSSVVCYVLANINVNNVSVTLCFSLQRSCKVRNLFNPTPLKCFVLTLTQLTFEYTLQIMIAFLKYSMYKIIKSKS